MAISALAVIHPIGSQPISGKNYEELPEAFRDKLDGFEMVIAYIENAQQPEISVVFCRMQMGVRLNPPRF